jgi:hypothetical protein
MFPSADVAIIFQRAAGKLVCSIQASPEFVERYADPPKVPASNLVPSADEATEYQLVVGAPVAVHVIPKFVEMYIEPGGEYGPATAANLDPSPEEAMAFQLFGLGALLIDQVAPELVEV